jgi:hypothetical protein
MLVMPLAQLSECFLAIHQFTSLGLRKAMLNLRGNIGAIIGQPSFVFMEHLNRLSDEFVDRLVRAAFHVFLDQRF